MSTESEPHPWQIRETRPRLDALGRRESIFALANGHIGLRGTFEEGEPHGEPGTYLNGVHETRPLTHAEPGYGFPEASQTVVHVTNGLVIRLLVDDEPFDLRYGTVREYERILDFRAGTLTREVQWCSPAGQTIRLRSVRLVSLVHRAIVAIRWEVEAVGDPARVVVQSELVANEDLPEHTPKDPRAAPPPRAPLAAEHADVRGARVTLVHRTRRSGLCVAAAMDHGVECAEAVEQAAEAEGDLGRLTLVTELPEGGRLRLDKLIAYGWSSERSVPAVRDQVHAALADAQRSGWDGLVAGQRVALDGFWERADVELDGDAELQQALRFALFQTFQSAARVEGRAIPAKGLTGRGYEGHAFWDTEVFVLPLLSYTFPHAADGALRWRHSTLPAARTRAEVLRMRGARFPWRTIGGEECSAYWPAGTAAFHVAADVAEAAARHVRATGDVAFEREIGMELIVETARLWLSVGHHDPEDGFRIDGVTGPDEYSALADNNVFTNLMAQRNLRAAAEVAGRHPDRARELGVDGGEVGAWRAAADAMVFPYDEALGIHPQAEGFTHHAEWDFEATAADEYPLLLHFPYFELYRSQVVKQPDLVLALHVCGDCFTPEEKARNFAHYEKRTVRDSSLSACTQAVIAAETGHLELAHDYLSESALIDLQDLHRNTASGLHIGSLAGAWLAAVAGFGGMRDHGDRLTFAPRLPPALTRLAFRLAVRGRRLKVTVARERATYEVTDGGAVDVWHHGDGLHVEPGAPVTRPIPPAPEVEPVSQPPHRRPLRRSPRPHPD